MLCDPPKIGGKRHLNLLQSQPGILDRLEGFPILGALAMSLFKSIAIVFLLLATPVSAQPPMLEETDAAELIGGAVQSAEGIEVGEVSAVTMKEDGEVTEIRMNMEQSLGMGERTVILPRGRYLVLRGTVILQLPLENVRQLPAVIVRGRQAGPSELSGNW